MRAGGATDTAAVAVAARHRGRSIPDARVEHGVEHVDHEIDDDIRAREHEDDALDHRIVAAQDRVDRQAAEARNREHALGDDDAADQQRDADADHRDDRDRGVAQRVPHQHVPGGEALGMRGADVVLAQRLQHRRARDARNQRHVGERERDARQDDVGQPRPEALGERRVALHRQPVELDREQPDQHVADDESRARKIRTRRSP